MLKNPYIRRIRTTVYNMYVYNSIAVPVVETKRKIGSKVTGISSTRTNECNELHNDYNHHVRHNVLYYNRTAM